MTSNAKRRGRLFESETMTKSGDGFSAVDNGPIPGYEEDAQQFGGYRDIVITLTNKLNLGNNYTEDHFATALVTAYPEDSDLMSYLGDLHDGDDITFKYRGNYGNHEDKWAMSDLWDFIKSAEPERDDYDEFEESTSKRGKFMNEERLIKTSYSTVKFADDDSGDYDEDHGWEDEQGESMEPDEYDAEDGLTAVDKAVDFLQKNGAVHPSSSQYDSRVWYSTEGQQNYRTGETTTYDYHLEGFSDDEMREIYKRVAQNGRRTESRKSKRGKAMNENKKILKEENSRDLSDLGARERMELVALLTAWNENGLPDGFDDSGVTFEFNPNSGYVFLVNDEYQTAMESDGKLYVFHSTPYSGLEGSIEDIMADNDPDSMEQDDIDYVVSWVQNYGADSIPDSWQALIDGAGGDEEQIEDSVQPRLREARKVTDVVVSAFLAGQKKSQGNTMTDGQALYLHGNKIAEKRNGSLWVSNAGWFSNTTKERLNGLPGVSVGQKNYEWFLNGKPWDGKWTEIGPVQEGRQLGESVNRRRKSGGKSRLTEASEVKYATVYGNEGIPIWVTDEGIQFCKLEVKKYISFTGNVFAPYTEAMARDWEADNISYQADYYWNDILDGGSRLGTSYGIKESDLGKDWNKIPPKRQKQYIDIMVDVMVQEKIEGREGEFEYVIDGGNGEQYYLETTSGGQIGALSRDENAIPLIPLSEIGVLEAAWKAFHLKNVDPAELQAGGNMNLLNQAREIMAKYQNDESLLTKAFHIYASKYSDSETFDDLMKSNVGNLDMNKNPNQTKLDFPESYKPEVTREHLKAAASMRNLLTENWKRLQSVGHRLVESDDNVVDKLQAKSNELGITKNLTDILYSQDYEKWNDALRRGWLSKEQASAWLDYAIGLGVFDSDAIISRFKSNLGESKLREAPEGNTDVYTPRDVSGRYVNIKVMPNKNLKLTLTDEGKTEIEDIQSQYADRPEANMAWYESEFGGLFDDIRGNSEYTYVPDLGDEGMGLTNAPGIIMGNMDDNGEWEPDVLVWYYNDYMLQSFLEDMMGGGTIFTYAGDDTNERVEQRTDESILNPKPFALASLRENYNRIMGRTPLTEAKNSINVGKYMIYYDTDKSQVTQQPWGNQHSFKDKITVKNTENNAKVTFNMHGSVADYQSNKPTDLMGAFGTFCREALDGMQYQSPEDIASEFGYDNPSEAKKVFRGLQQMAAKAEKIGMTEDELIDLLNGELADY